MKTKVLDKAAILAKYPEEKPVCINYTEMRGELIALAEKHAELRLLLGYKSGE